MCVLAPQALVCGGITLHPVCKILIFDLEKSEGTRASKKGVNCLCEQERDGDQKERKESWNSHI